MTQRGCYLGPRIASPISKIATHGPRSIASFDFFNSRQFHLNIRGVREVVWLSARNIPIYVGTTEAPRYIARIDCRSLVIHPDRIGTVREPTRSYNSAAGLLLNKNVARLLYVPLPPSRRRQGKLKEDIIKNDPEEYAAWVADPSNFNFSGRYE